MAVDLKFDATDDKDSLNFETALNIKKISTVVAVPRDSSVGRAVDCSATGYPSVAGSIPARETSFWCCF
jgi:hypothetical protein